MRFALLVVVVGVAVGLLAGGRLRNLLELELVWVVAVAAGLVLQIVVDVAAARSLIGPSVATAGLVVSELLVLAFVVANRSVPGMWIVGVGFALNAAVIVANGAMPVDPEAIRSLGGDAVRRLAGKHELLTAGSRLPWLADRLPVPVLRVVLSLGDLVLGIGIVRLTVAALRDPIRHGASRTAAGP